MNVKLLIEKFAMLDLQCKDLLASNTTILISIKKIQGILAAHYSDAKNKYNTTTFESSQQQIDYFKLYHSKLISLCLFYKSIRSIEQRLLSISIPKQINILREEVEALDSISQDHHSFIVYITEQAIHFDKDYFTLDNEKEPFDSFSFMERDPLFSTHHSFLLGKILSWHRTLDYINNKLDSLKNKNTPSNASLLTLKWNRKKVDFVEVIRALHAEGAFEEDVTTIFNALSQVIITGSLDHFAHYKDIKYRANSNIKYLTKAAKALQYRIDEDFQ